MTELLLTKTTILNSNKIVVVLAVIVASLTEEVTRVMEIYNPKNKTRHSKFLINYETEWTKIRVLKNKTLNLFLKTVKMAFQMKVTFLYLLLKQQTLKIPTNKLLLLVSRLLIAKRIILLSKNNKVHNNNILHFLFKLKASKLIHVKPTTI